MSIIDNNSQILLIRSKVDFQNILQVSYNIVIDYAIKKNTKTLFEIISIDIFNH